MFSAGIMTTAYPIISNFYLLLPLHNMFHRQYLYIDDYSLIKCNRYSYAVNTAHI